MDTIEPRLPPELEHRIFMETALLHRSSIPTLLLVARRVFEWTEPMLYRNVYIDLEKKVGAAAEILRCLESGRKTQAFFRAAVHSVALDAWITSRKPWTDEEFDKVVSACGGVEYLLLIAFFTDSNPEANLEPLLRAIRPTHCFLLSADPGPTLAAYPGFAERMTHLTMLCFFPPDSDAPENHLNFCNPRNVDNLRLIPSLKHLATALPSPPKAEMAADAILSACPKLQTLVFLGFQETRLVTCNDPTDSATDAWLSYTTTAWMISETRFGESIAV